MTAEQDKMITALYTEMYDWLFFTALKNEDNEALAEEAVQEVFHIACQKPEECCNSQNPQGWLVYTLYYVIRNEKKKRATAKKYLEKYLALNVREAYVSEDRIDLEVLYQNVAKTEEWKLLSEMVLEGLSHQEMARKRGISVPACKKRVQRAREELQRRLKDLVTN